MDYKAIFDIDGAVSRGFGLKFPDHYQKTEVITVDSPEDAMIKAVEKARYHTKESLSNPETDCTVVKLIRLQDQSGKDFVEQIKALPKDFLNRYPEIFFEEGIPTAKCSNLEHLLLP